MPVIFLNMKNRLFALAADGKLAALERKLQSGNTGVNEKSDLGYTPLAIAVARGHHDIAKLLLDHGATANTKDYKGNTPLHYVGENNLLETGKLLLAKNADLSILNKSGNQPLWFSVFNVRGDKSKHALVVLFLEHGADPNHKNSAGMSALAFAKQVGKGTKS